MVERSAARPGARRLGALVATLAAAATAVGTGSTGAGAISTVASTKPTPSTTSSTAGATGSQPVVLPNGRLVRPYGTRFDTGLFPTGVAVSPDGRLAVTANNGRGTGLAGGFGSQCDQPPKANRCGYVPAPLVGDPATAVPDQSLSVIDLRRRKVADVTAVPTRRDLADPQSNFFGPSLAFSPDGTHLYATGGGNDSVYDFAVRDARLETPPRTLTLPSATTATGTPKIPIFGSILGEVHGFTKGLAVTPDGKQLLVLKQYDNDVTAIDTATMTATSTLPLDHPAPVFGSYLDSVAVDPAGKHAYVTALGTGLLHVLDHQADGTWTANGTVKVGDHPEGVAVAPGGREVLVANANDDTVAVVRTTDRRVRRIPIHAVAGETWGSSPTAVAFARDGRRAFVTLSGDDAVAVLRRANGRWAVEGFVPTGWYPDGVAVEPRSGDVLVSSAKGFGSRYPKNGVIPAPTRGGPQGIDRSFVSVDVNMPGFVSRFAVPTGSRLGKLSADVRTDIRYVTRDLRRSAHNPVPARVGDPSPIKHVIYVVRENRTFDQVFGDLGKSRNDVDADPSFELLASATPNAHKLQQSFATSDRFFSDGEASIQGHWWTAGANVSDYTEKNWLQNYSDRGIPYDFVVPAAQTRGCTILESALTKSKATNGAFTFRDYGEFLGILAPSGTFGIGTPGREPHECTNLLNTPYFDSKFLDGINDLSRDDRKRLTWFLDDVGLDAQGHHTDPAKTLPNFSYLTLPEDHTTGLRPGGASPRAEVAQNDAALGTLVSAISHSDYWKDTAIFVVEDDSVDGADHVDGHRNVLLVISPWAKHTADAGTGGSATHRPTVGGYVSHAHSDLVSVVRTIDLVLGLPPMSAYEQFALPLYDVFQNVDDPARLTASDLAPYDPAPDAPFIEETGDQYLGPEAAALKAATAKLNLRGVDRAGPMLEVILWRTAKPGAAVPADLARRAREHPVRVADDDG
ncbi:MAG: bifunctional YncE family protein/alkaline phosphatase family protein [Acidimicrobiia bacterium]